MREVESSREKRESLLSLKSIFKKETAILNAYFNKKWDEILSSFLLRLKSKSLSSSSKENSLQKNQSSLMPINKKNIVFYEEIQKLKVLSRASFKLSNTENHLKLSPKSNSYLKNIPVPLQDLFRSMHYSLFSEGQRFRPLLALLVAKSLKCNLEDVLPFSLALEMVHTYSLIHDDLPCMDDALQRRGLLANHKVFGEALSLLSGTALLTEAYSLLSLSYFDEPDLVVKLIYKLSEILGPLGMVGGQSMDMAIRKEQKPKTNPLKRRTYFENLEELSIRKTGSLLQYSLFGSAAICGAPLDLQDYLNSYGMCLGFAFQLADDILDFNKASIYKKKKESLKDLVDSDKEPSFVDFLGEKNAKDLLDTLTEEAISFIPGREFKALKKMALYNRSRIRIKKGKNENF